MADISIGILVALVGIALLAGWMDAVLGGGGLIQVPALLILAPQMSAQGAVGTSKIAALMGTAYAIYAFRQKSGLVNFRMSISLGLVTAAAGMLGAGVLLRTSQEVYIWSLLGVCIICPIAVLVKDRVFGEIDSVIGVPESRFRNILLLLGALLLGFYDGFVGPGTGTWIIYLLGLVMSLNILAASANAKVVNFFTYLGPLAVLGWGGHMSLALGLPMGFASIVGAHFGSSFALRASQKKMGLLLVVLVSALCLSLLCKIFF